VPRDGLVRGRHNSACSSRLIYTLAGFSLGNRAVAEHDHRENEFSLQQGFRLLSAYTLNSGTKIWIITEADRSATTVLLPEEY
jgi:hypothetical protein